MKNFGKSISFVSVLSFLVVACSSPDKSNEPLTPQQIKEAKRDASMKALAATISDLLPLVASRSKFTDPKYRETIERDTNSLKQLAHSIADMPGTGDPGAKVVQEYFSEDISRALEAYQSGQTEYARHVLKDTTNYCIQCHTYSEANKTGAKINLDPASSDMSPLEKAEFYAATRQNDRALEAYMQGLSDKSAVEKNPFEWEVAARTALAIAVSRDMSPKKTAKLVDQIAKNPQIPKATVPVVRAWKTSVREWLKSKKTPNDPAKKLETARSLVQTAQKRQEFPLDHSQDILYFRASTLLHDALKEKSLAKDQRAQALFWSGVAAEATRDMNFWTLHETYYEQCIRLVPETPQAKECFAKLKESVILGYSGSAGTNLPASQVKRLDTLGAIADGASGASSTH
jgi:hypothetical protein